MLITVFTPTYNRANLLPRLYESLKQQKSKHFEWIIVDDGSTDNTQKVVNTFISEKKIPIVYFRKENGGKHIAINKGLELAKGELFFIVDSDDILPQQSLNDIYDKYKFVRHNSEVGGVIGRKAYFDNNLIGSNIYFEDKITSVFDFRYKMKMSGDMSEVFKTDILKSFQFPMFENEKFCPEALVWNRIGLEYKFLFTNEIFYQAEYQPGGLSDNIFKIRKKSCEGTLLYYKELESMPIPLIQKIKANINYWRFAKFSKRSFISKFKEVNSFYSLLGLPLSLIFLLKDPK